MPLMQEAFRAKAFVSVCRGGGAGWCFCAYRTEERLLLFIGYKVMEGPCSRPVAETGSTGCFHTHKSDPLALAGNFRKSLPLVMSLECPLLSGLSLRLL